jgi:hypothetical protein
MGYLLKLLFNFTLEICNKGSTKENAWYSYWEKYKRDEFILLLIEKLKGSSLKNK